MEKQQDNLHCAFYLKGIPVSRGIAISKAFPLSGESVKIDPANIAAGDVESEVEKFRKAVEKAKGELRSLQTRVSRRIGQESAKIFDVHQLLLEDSLIIDETVSYIRKRHKSADSAFYDIMQKYQNTFDETSVEFFQGRASDIKDVKRRVIKHIQGDRTDYLNKLKGSAVVVAVDLTPSDAVKLDRHKLMGFATDLGGRTSHVAIMARSMGIPAVVGLRRISKVIKADDRIIIDGNDGAVLIEPDEETLKYYRELQEQYYDTERRLSEIRDLPCVTMDGKEIELSANLEFSDEALSAKTYGACGIGLFRTDYLYLATDCLPSEDEQVDEYSKIAKVLSPAPVIIRTMDLGGDKHPKSLAIPPEENPFLGWRAIRISLDRKDIFNTQLRAILRASRHGNIKMLFPMISGLDELLECKHEVEKVKTALRREKIPFDETIELGVMIEVPSAAMMADRIAEHVDFLSIGTNDLVQYVLAVDRGNERIAYLYQHLHPAVLRTIQRIVEAGHRAGVWVGMCGEMASDPLATLILLGLDLDELSVSPMSVPQIKKIIRATDYPEAVRITRKALTFDKAKDVERFMTKVVRRRYKDIVF